MNVANCEICGGTFNDNELAECLNCKRLFCDDCGFVEDKTCYECDIEVDYDSNSDTLECGCCACCGCSCNEYDDDQDEDFHSEGGDDPLWGNEWE